MFTQDVFFLIHEYLTLSDLKSTMLVNREWNSNLNNCIWFIQYKRYFHSKKEGRNKNHPEVNLSCVHSMNEKFFAKLEPYFQKPSYKLLKDVQFSDLQLVQSWKTEKKQVLFSLIEKFGCPNYLHCEKVQVVYKENVDFRVKLIPLVVKCLKKVSFTKKDQKRLKQLEQEKKDLQSKMKFVSFFKNHQAQSELNVRKKEMDLELLDLQKRQKLTQIASFY